MLLQLASVLIAIIVGARIGGIGLGALGGLGPGILTFGFGLQPTFPPIDVMLIIVAVIVTASCIQAAGELDLMVKRAEKLLRKNPQRVTILSPLVTYLFTFIAGTGHVTCSVLPIIIEVATETKIRPGRPMAIAVIASQRAVAAGPMSAATVALLNMLSGHNISLMNILMISVPCILLGMLVGAIYSLKVDKELDQDPECLKRVANHEFSTEHHEAKDVENQVKVALSVSTLVLATTAIIIFGSMESLCPVSTVGTGKVSIQMSHIIEVLMLAASTFTLLFTKADSIKAAQGSVFSAGMQAVVAIFGITWMGDTFIAGNMTELKGSIEHTVTQISWLSGLALFVMSILLFSQAVIIRASLPLGVALEISPYMLVALFPAINGYFFIPNYPTVVAATNFDRAGAIRIGKYISDRSFMMPGLTVAGVSVRLGLPLVQFI